MIKISELEKTTANALLANTTAILPVVTGNTSLETFKVNVADIGLYILSNVGSATISGNLTAGNVLIGEVLTAANATITSKDRKSTRLNSSHVSESRMPSSA